MIQVQGSGFGAYGFRDFRVYRRFDKMLLRGFVGVPGGASRAGRLRM